MDHALIFEMVNEGVQVAFDGLAKREGLLRLAWNIEVCSVPPNTMYVGGVLSPWGGRDEALRQFTPWATLLGLAAVETDEHAVVFRGDYRGLAVQLSARRPDEGSYDKDGDLCPATREHRRRLRDDPAYRDYRPPGYPHDNIYRMHQEDFQDGLN